MAAYDDYQDELDRFLKAWDQLQRDTLARDRVNELAERRGMTVEEVHKILERIDQSLRLLHAPNRPTRAEIVRLALDAQKSD